MKNSTTRAGRNTEIFYLFITKSVDNECNIPYNESRIKKGEMKMITLSNTEKKELTKLYSEGFRYLVRNQVGTVEVFVKEPTRTRDNRLTFDIWVEKENPYPIITPEKMKRRKSVDSKRYTFVKWESEPVLIEELIK